MERLLKIALEMTERAFEILQTLGVGGMATVYLARRGRRVVALKKLHAFLADDPACIDALHDEADLGACMRHPNIVSVLGLVAGEDDGGPALVMEWVEGVDLAKLLRVAATRHRRLPLDVVAAIVCDALAGLHAAHESRRDDGAALEIVHRDVSPQNILVGADGATRVGDFGVATTAMQRQVTALGTVKGKLGYLAPEQLAGHGDRRADVFGVGVVLWEMLTGDRLRASDGLAVLAEILCHRPDPPSSRCLDAACLDAVVMGALERCPDDRFATAHEMRAAILGAVTPATAEDVAAAVRAIMEDDEDELSQTGVRRCARSVEGSLPVRSSCRDTPFTGALSRSRAAG